MRSRRERKKQREREQLAEFKNLYKDFPEGKISDSEEPDFLVETGNQILGIDILEFHKKEGDEERGSLIRERESFQERLTEKAQSLFEEEDQVPLLVNIFAPGRLQSVKNYTPLASEIAKLIKRHLPQASYEPIHLDKNALPDKLIPLINSISITRLKPGASSYWGCTNRLWPETSFDELQQEISKKDNKIEKYLEQCSSAWLLIVVNTEYVATKAEFPRDLASHPFKFRFDRVFVFDYARGHIIALTRDT